MSEGELALLASLPAFPRTVVGACTRGEPHSDGELGKPLRSLGVVTLSIVPSLMTSILKNIYHLQL